jgi:hypothetical protein
VNKRHIYNVPDKCKKKKNEKYINNKMNTIMILKAVKVCQNMTNLLEWGWERIQHKHCTVAEAAPIPTPTNKILTPLL